MQRPRRCSLGDLPPAVHAVYLPYLTPYNQLCVRELCESANAAVSTTVRDAHWERLATASLATDPLDAPAFAVVRDILEMEREEFAAALSDTCPANADHLFAVFARGSPILLWPHVSPLSVAVGHLLDEATKDDNPSLIREWVRPAKIPKMTIEQRVKLPRNEGFARDVARFLEGYGVVGVRREYAGKALPTVLLECGCQLRADQQSISYATPVGSASEPKAFHADLLGPNQQSLAPPPTPEPRKHAKRGSDDDDETVSDDVSWDDDSDDQDSSPGRKELLRCEPQLRHERALVVPTRDWAPKKRDMYDTVCLELAPQARRTLTGGDAVKRECIVPVPMMSAHVIVPRSTQRISRQVVRSRHYYAPKCFVSRGLDLSLCDPDVEIAMCCFDGAMIKILDLSALNSLETVGKAAFKDNRITSLVLPPHAGKANGSIFVNAGYGAARAAPVPTRLAPTMWLEALPQRAFAHSIAVDTLDLSCHANLSKIGKDAFYSCQIRMVRLPAKLKCIESDAFNSNRALQQIDFAPCAEYAEDHSVELEICSNTFGGCHGLIRVQFPPHLTELGDCAFHHCVNLVEADFSKCYDLRVVGNNVFQHCPLLQGVNLAHCLALTELNGLLSDRPLSGPVVLPPTVRAANLWDTVHTEVPAGLFRPCKDLELVRLPPHMATIGASAFEGCSRADFALTLKEHAFNISELGSRCFAGTGITKLPISRSMAKLGVEACMNCTALTTVTLTEWSKAGLTSIPARCFAGCTSLTSVNIEEFHSCNVIDEEAFLNCESLKTVVVPYALQRVGRSAFEGCVKLNPISFSSMYDGLMTIEPRAFRGCKALNEVRAKGCKHLETIAEDAFDGCHDALTFQLHEVAKDFLLVTKQLDPSKVIAASA